MNRKWDVDDKQLNQKCIDEVITRIQEIDDTEQVGVIAAQELIDIVTENLARVFYNKGVNDSKQLLQTKQHDLETEIDLLRQ